MPSLWLISLVALVLTLPGLSSAQGTVEVRDGEKGYIHLIIRGDTLWDISSHYLGTPWIWPSVWGENPYIANPHLIYPKNEVWISESLLRKLTREQAERLRQAMAEAGENLSTSQALEILRSEDRREDMAAAHSEDGDGSERGDGSRYPDGSEHSDGSRYPDGSEYSDGSRSPDGSEYSDGSRYPDGSEYTDGSRYPDGSEYADAIPRGESLLEFPGDLDEEPEELPSRDDPFAALDQGETGVSRVMRFSGLHRYGFVSDLQYAGTAAVMGSHEAHYWSSQGQRTIVSLGEGKAHMGDALTIFRTIKRVRHPETREHLGYFVEVLGRAEVTEIHPGSSYVRITMSYAEIEPGDRVMPYVQQPTEFIEVHSEDRVEGRVLAYQPYRLRSSSGDLVVLDRGLREGITPGRRFELYRSAQEARDPATLETVIVPDDVIGGAFVVKVSEKTSLALVTRARTDVLIGDRFRSHR